MKGPADVEPDKWIKPKVSRLQVPYAYRAHCVALAAIDVQYLRTLVVDSEISDADWFPTSAITELHILSLLSGYAPEVYVSKEMVAMVKQAPRSIEVLCIDLGCSSDGFQIAIRIFDGLGWENLPLLRSLGLYVPCQLWEIPHVSRLPPSNISCSI